VLKGPLAFRFLVVLLRMYFLEAAVHWSPAHSSRRRPVSSGLARKSSYLMAPT
jgi:hypothetical protein